MKPPWMTLGACAGMGAGGDEMFFPTRGESTREAKAVCARCVVRAVCLDYALENNEKFGIWGGASERERRRLRRARGLSLTRGRPAGGHNIDHGRAS